MLPDYNSFYKDITATLEKGLNPKLYYHGYHHIMYVLDAATRIAAHSDLTEKELLLLKTAVLLHDSGFLHTYNEHEVAGTEIANEMLPKYGYSKNDLKIINGMIMATRIPQTPTNKLEEIIADADLEYLGTDNFDEISEYLYNELIAFGFIKNREEWNQIQVRFMTAHKYFTDYCKTVCEPHKQKRLKELRKLID